MKFLSIAPVSSVLLLCAISLQGAHAQAKPDRLLTRDELRVCLNTDSELAARRKALEPRGERNRAEAAAIRAEAEQMTEEQKRIVENNGPMDRFERRVKTHNARVQAARASAESFRADVDALNKALVAQNERCGGISFKVEDRDAILKEREAAPK